MARSSPDPTFPRPSAGGQVAHETLSPQRALNLRRLTVNDQTWDRLLDRAPVRGEAGAVYGGWARDAFVLAQVGQSLDGRVATLAGDARDISGPDGLTHLHRLRALADAVLIGVGTAIADDPQLTTRRVEGPSPARVVIDPMGRLPPTARMLHDDGPPVLVLRSPAASTPAGAETLTLQDAGVFEPRAIIAALAARGLRRLLVEGGGVTIARFLDAGALDRLQVTVAPLIIGSGKAGINLSAIGRLSQARRPTMTAYDLGSDVLFDCALR